MPLNRKQPRRDPSWIGLQPDPAIFHFRCYEFLSFILWTTRNDNLQLLLWYLAKEYYYHKSFVRVDFLKTTVFTENQIKTMFQGTANENHRGVFRIKSSILGWNVNACQPITIFVKSFTAKNTVISPLNISSQNFHTRELGEITIFFAMLDLICWLGSDGVSGLYIVKI